MLILVLEFSKLESGVVYSVMKFYGIHQVSVWRKKKWNGVGVKSQSIIDKVYLVCVL